MVCPFVSRVGKEIDLYILKLTMVISEEGVITHAYQKKGYQSLHTPQQGLYHNCPTRGYPCIHTIPSIETVALPLSLKDHTIHN
jgi:hypothetical protein